YTTLISAEDRGLSVSSPEFEFLLATMLPSNTQADIFLEHSMRMAEMFPEKHYFLAAKIIFLYKAGQLKMAEAAFDELLKKNKSIAEEIRPLLH
ncbi:MAG: hypothetical protein Q7R79_03255, partial [bacterium]|nr:hypothetical protein [bacterium]